VLTGNFNGLEYKNRSGEIMATRQRPVGAEKFQINSQTVLKPCSAGLRTLAGVLCSKKNKEKRFPIPSVADEKS
jgi:hypothetical protein